jgi:hypothetical protein
VRHRSHIIASFVKSMLILVGIVVRIGEINVYRILTGNRIGKLPLVRPRSRRNDNFKIELREMSCYNVNSVG